MNLRLGLSASLLGITLLAHTAWAAPEKINVSVDRQQQPIYQKGETIVFTIAVPDVPEQKMRYTLHGDRTVTPWTEAPANGQPITVKTKLDAPGWVCVTAELLDREGKSVAKSKTGCGAVVAPDEIRQGGQEPADFDAYWAKQRAELDKVPVKVLECKEVEVPEAQKGKFVCYDVKIACFGDKPVSGYLTMPVGAKPKSLPIRVNYHGAGWRSSYKMFMNNAICFDVNAHGVENGQPAEYYEDLRKNALANYMYRGKANRDTFYFRNMFMRVMRALDYVKTLPEWDGKRLLVSGSSQGGAQALVAAALDKDVIFCAAGVPAMCDHQGGTLDRQPGWPRLVKTAEGKALEPAVAETAAYYDAATFAKRVKCEAILSVGLTDFTCSPTSVYSAYNNLPGGVKKQMDISATKGHDGSILKSPEKRYREIMK